MERILIYNTWIVMLRFTVVPLTGFEAFGHRSGERRGDLDIHVRYGNQLFIVN
jgi:hypothetical protein